MEGVWVLGGGGGGEGAGGRAAKQVDTHMKVRGVGEWMGVDGVWGEGWAGAGQLNMEGVWVLGGGEGL